MIQVQLLLLNALHIKCASFKFLMLKHEVFSEVFVLSSLCLAFIIYTIKKSLFGVLVPKKFFIKNFYLYGWQQHSLFLRDAFCKSVPSFKGQKRRSVSLTAVSDQRLCLWNLPTFWKKLDKNFNLLRNRIATKIFLKNLRNTIDSHVNLWYNLNIIRKGAMTMKHCWMIELYLICLFRNYVKIRS